MRTNRKYIARKYIAECRRLKATRRYLRRQGKTAVQIKEIIQSRKQSVGESNHQKLARSFRTFIGMFHTVRKTPSFYRNYKLLSEILFTPGELIQYAESGKKYKDAVIDVVRFLGLKISEKNFKQDLYALNKNRKKNPLTFDADAFAKQMFYATDTKATGFIDFEEFHTLLTEMRIVEDEESNSHVKGYTSKVTVSKSDAQKLFKAVDTKTTGNLDLEEFTAFWAEQDDLMSKNIISK